MFTLTLVTPEKKLIAGKEVEEVTVPAFRGEIDVLPGHAPLMTTLSTGVLKYREKGGDVHRVAISWGYCQVGPAGVNILAETAERPEEIDLPRAEKTLSEAEARLAAADMDVEMLDKTLQKIQRARVRKDLASGNTTDH